MLPKKSSHSSMSVDTPSGSRQFPIAVAGGLLIVIFLAAVFLWMTKGLPKASKNPSLPMDVTTLVDRVGRHILVNANESPTVATIQDAEMLRAKEPRLYKDAQIGDRLLVWSDKIILYSESRDLVLAVLNLTAPSMVQNQDAVMASSTQTQIVSTASSTAAIKNTIEEKASVEVLNGTKTAGLAGALVKKLKASGFTVLSPRDTLKKDYPKTLVIHSSSNSFPQTTERLLKNVQGQLASWPEGEVLGGGDIVVIIGDDYTMSVL